MRFAFLLALCALLLTPLVAVACGDDDDDDGGRLQVVATTAIIGSLTSQVGGEHISLTVLAKAGVDPHEYELTPSDRVAVENAAVVLRNGIGLDAYLDSIVDDGDGKVVTVTEGITILDGDAHEDEDHEDEDHDEDEDHEDEEHEDEDEHGHDHEEGDPHVWHDPANAKVMATNIAEALAAADPTNAATYRANAGTVGAELDAVDAEIRTLIEGIPAENRKMVTNHEAFGYLIERYGLEFVGAVIPSTTTGAEPSARSLAELSDLIRSEGVKAIFAESSVDPRVAQQLANDTGVRVVDDLYGDSLGDPGSGAETVAGMLRANATKIAEALQ